MSQERIDRHRKAAEHHEHAATHHNAAADRHEAGDHEKGGHQADTTPTGTPIDPPSIPPGNSSNG